MPGVFGEHGGGQCGRNEAIEGRKGGGEGREVTGKITQGGSRGPQGGLELFFFFSLGQTSWHAGS